MKSRSDGLQWLPFPPLRKGKAAPMAIASALLRHLTANWPDGADFACGDAGEKREWCFSGSPGEQGAFSNPVQRVPLRFRPQAAGENKGEAEPFGPLFFTCS
ncbi:hypothetical protein [Pantoea sp. KPR_PJ]|uniref:hypothetical protein n=1 Tax=Pantoea sp. KPR_PJ TaxID=2738375 RepID=UPI003527B623